MLNKLQKTALFILCLAIVIALMPPVEAANLINISGVFAIGLCIVLCPLYIIHYKPQAELPLKMQEVLRATNMEKDLSREHLSFMDGNTAPRIGIKVRRLSESKVNAFLAKQISAPIAHHPAPQQVIINESCPNDSKVNLPSIDKNGLARLSAFSKWISTRQ